MSIVTTRPTTQRVGSPEYLQMSLAAAMTLNLKEGLFFRNARLYCLNLLLTYPDGCRGNCSYCGLQKSRDGAFAEKQAFFQIQGHGRRQTHLQIIRAARREGRRVIYYSHKSLNSLNTRIETNIVTLYLR